MKVKELKRYLEVLNDEAIVKVMYVFKDSCDTDERIWCADADCIVLRNDEIYISQSLSEMI